MRHRCPSTSPDAVPVMVTVPLSLDAGFHVIVVSTPLTFTLVSAGWLFASSVVSCDMTHSSPDLTNDLP